MFMTFTSNIHAILNTAKRKHHNHKFGIIFKLILKLGPQDLTNHMLSLNYTLVRVSRWLHMMF